MALGLTRSPKPYKAFRCPKIWCHHPPVAIWSLLEEWEDGPPLGSARHAVLDDQEIEASLEDILKRAGLNEDRQPQFDFARATKTIYDAKFVADQPNIILLQAGTGIGKTLAYLSSAIAYARKSQGQVWITTYTRAYKSKSIRIQDPYSATLMSMKKLVSIRKGRENYLCLLNYQEKLSNLHTDKDGIYAALLARWIVYSRDGDLLGGDYPTWLTSLFAPKSGAIASPILNEYNLIDRRGECIHSACAHYRTCFVEKSIRKSRQAQIVIANHALVLNQAAFDYQSTITPIPLSDTGDDVMSCLSYRDWFLMRAITFLRRPTMRFPVS